MGGSGNADPLVSALGERDARAPSQLAALRRGRGIHWPDVDEDLSLEGFLAGRRSGVSK